MLSHEQLKKKVLVFGLEDVLVPGAVEKKVKKKDVDEILKQLKALAKKYEDFHYYLITGLPEAEAKKRIAKHKLEKYFDDAHSFSVNKPYLDSKTEVDRQLYDDHLAKNPLFKDEYFKQQTIESIVRSLGVSKEEVQLIGNDVWTEGFYTRRFSGVEFALIRSALAARGEPLKEPVVKLVYMDRKWKDVEALIRGALPKADYTALDKFVNDTMREKLFEGTQMQGISRLAK